MERIFEAGFREFVKLRRQTGLTVAVVMDGTRRAMRATYQREMDYLESHLSFLATVGSVSPYVGLLGTVWGIMNAFRGLANVQQATLAHVAPGIAEALIATAIGLFAAIPAVVAFNYYAREIDRLVHALRDLHGGVLQHPAAPGRRTGPASEPMAGSRRERAPQANPPDEPDQRRALHRRDAGAAGDLHGHRAADQHQHDRSALGQPQQPAAGERRSRS